MKRIGMFGFALAALLTPAALRAQAIAVKPAGELSSLVGLPFDVPVTADMSARAERLGSFALRLTWDPAVLRLDGGVAGSFGSATVNTDSLAAGILRMAGVNPSGAAGMVTLGIARFTPISGGTTPLGLTLPELYASGSFADLLPSAVVSGGLYCPALGRFGDVDDDGSANSRDALVALSNAVGLDVSAFDIALGDVDGNGATNARDALIILSSAVGLDVSGFRVMRLAGGSCALNAPLTMSVTPSPLDLVLGQSAKLEARAANGSGVLQSLPDVVWKSSAPGVAAVTSDGRVLARSAGSAVVTALRGFTDSAQATITVVARRTRHVVDALAVNAGNRLGSAALPFASIAEALQFAQPGDTIQIRPGRYDDLVDVDREVVLMGDTALDGSRPVLTGLGGLVAGVILSGAGDRELHNLAFDNVFTAVSVFGPSNVLLRGVRANFVYEGVALLADVSGIRIENSVLLGQGVDSDGGSGVDYEGYSIDTLVIEDTEIGDFGDNAIQAEDVDSVVVRRSNFHDFGRYAIELAEPNTGVILVADSNTIQRAGYGLVYIYDLRAAAFRGNVLHQVYGDIIEAYQEDIPNGGYVRLKGDSISCVECGYWLDLNYLDSLTVDSVRAVLPDAGSYIYNVVYVRVRGGYFRDVDDDVFNIYSGSNVGGVAEFRNTTFVGNPRCDFCADAIYTGDHRTTVDSVTFVNMYQAVETYGDSSLTVTNSTFRRVEYGVQFYGNYYVGCTYYCGGGPTVGLTMRNNSFDGFYYGVEAYDGQMVVEDNTFVAGRSFGVETGGASGQSVQRNVFDDVDDAIEVDLYDSSATAVIADNVFTRATGTVIYAYGESYPDTLRSRHEILRNQISCVPTDGADGIDLYYSDALVADNDVVGCSSGIYLYGPTGTTTRADTVVGNTISLPANPYGGIVARYNLRSVISRNAVTADTIGSISYAVISVEGYYYTGYLGSTYVDSNTVNGGVYAGIQVQDIDTAVVRWNTIQDVAGDGVAFLYNLKSFAAAQGNTIRRAGSSAVYVYSYDTTTVQVDSNMISGSSTGIYLGYGSSLVTRNTVTGNGYGILIPYYVTGNTSITLNNISGNGFGLADYTEGYYAQNNWWGDLLGPRCASGCNPLSVGDSVTNSWAVDPWLLAPNGSSPPPAPRALPVVAVRAPRVSALRGLSSAERLPPARTAEYERPARARPAATPAARVATPLTQAQAQARAQAVQARTRKLAAREASRGQVESRREAEQVTRERAVRERVDRRKSEVEQVRAARRAERRQAAAQPARRP